MKLLKSFFGLLYNLVIGDCWQVTAGTVAVLLAGIAVLRLDAVPASTFAVGLGAAIMACAAAIIYVEARVAHRRSQDRRGG